MMPAKSMSSQQPVSGGAGPFALANTADYARWREAKLRAFPRTPQNLRVPVADVAGPTEAERAAIIALCKRANVAIYCAQQPQAVDKAALRRFGAGFGLRSLDGNLCADDDNVSSLRVMPEGRHAEYIPYTDRPLNWHTDGYYNLPDQRIRAFILHCVSPAHTGGENQLFDPEIMYILLRDEDPALIEVLMQPDAMTIPPNIENGVELRGTQTGPVFCFDEIAGTLHMRYTARQRNVIWKDDAMTRAAATRILELLNGDSPWLFRYRLAPGEGIICNNVLHARSAFSDEASGSQRLLYRARYHDRIIGTDGNFATQETA